MLILVGAALLRLGAVWVLHDNLFEDRDAYRSIADSLVDGRGYANRGSDHPTAFRPPLYPLFLSAIQIVGGGPTAIGMAQVVLGTATVWLTFLIGRRMGASQSMSYLAAVLVAVDPLLIMYTTFVMTEALFTCLVAVLLFFVVDKNPEEESGNETAARSQTSRRPDFVRQVAAGLAFGLCALCRPTIWAFGVLLAVSFVSAAVSKGGFWEIPKRVPWVAICVLGLTVAPWALRNQMALGRPVVTTTHGGYTLLLGNNPVFYQGVVNQPRGTVWRGESLETWQQSLEVEMAQQSIVGELNRDDWMEARAWHNIAEDVPDFLRASWLRLRRLWNLVPSGEAAESVPWFVRWGVGVYYGLTFFGGVWAIIRFERENWVRWLPLLLLLVSFSLVHTVYWSNVRMRAPLVPAIALLSAYGWAGLAGWRQQRST